MTDEPNAPMPERTWDDLTPAEQANVLYRDSVECKAQILDDNAPITDQESGSGDVITVAELAEFILRRWQDGFTASGRKDGDDVLLQDFEAGFAATVPYTELELSSSLLSQSDPDEIAKSLVRSVIDWHIEHRTLLEKKNAKIGGYNNRKRGVFEINISMVFYPGYSEVARRFCEDGNQISMYDFATGREIETGGTGQHITPPDSWRKQLI